MPWHPSLHVHARSLVSELSKLLRKTRLRIHPLHFLLIAHCLNLSTQKKVAPVSSLLLRHSHLAPIHSLRSFTDAVDDALHLPDFSLVVVLRSTDARRRKRGVNGAMYASKRGRYYFNPASQEEKNNCPNRLPRREIVSLAGTRVLGKTTRMRRLDSRLSERNFLCIA